MGYRKKYNLVVSSLIAAGLLSACSPNEVTQKPQQEKVQEQNTTQNEEQPAQVNESTDTNTQVTSLKKIDQEINLGELEEYDLTKFFIGREIMIAPEYVFEGSIYYSAMRNESSGEIFVYDSTIQENKSIYTTSITIGNLVGVQDHLFWVEYGSATEEGMNWSIKSMNLTNSQVSTVEDGISKFDTPVPYVESSKDHVSWIDHNATEEKTISEIKQFVPSTQKKSIIKSYELKEGDTRTGEYPFDFRDGEDGIIVHKTLFKDGKKTPILTTLHNEYEEPAEALVDFEKGSRYLALGKEGKAHFESLEESNLTYEFQAGQNTITVDAFKFLDEEKILFREGMHKLYVADLGNKTIAPVKSNGGTTSKPIYTNGYISYGELKNGEIKYYLIQKK